MKQILIGICVNLVLQILNQGNGKKDFPCIRLFRHLMVDVVSVNCFGYRLGALKKFAVGEEEVLCTAVEDFPKRGVMVTQTTFPFANATHRSLEKCGAYMGLVTHLFYPQCSLETALRLGQSDGRCQLQL